MNLIRSLMTFLMLLLLTVVVAGWIWSSDLPSPKLGGARIALSLCGVMAAGAIVLLWREKPISSDREE